MNDNCLGCGTSIELNDDTNRWKALPVCIDCRWEYIMEGTMGEKEKEVPGIDVARSRDESPPSKEKWGVPELGLPDDEGNERGTDNMSWFERFQSYWNTQINQSEDADE